MEQKVLKYTSIQKLDALCRPVGWHQSRVAYCHNRPSGCGPHRRLRPAGLADQSVLADTLDAARETDVAGLAAAIADLFGQYSQARQHAFDQELLVLDVDLSPLPAIKRAERSERFYLGRSRSKTGRKLVRARAAGTGEIMWETVISARTVESLPVLQEAIQAAEVLLGIA